MSVPHFLSSELKAKRDFQLEQLDGELSKDFSRDIKSLKGDEFGDINIRIAQKGIHLRHRCIISAVSSLLEHLSEGDGIVLDDYPNAIQSHEKEALEFIYSVSDQIFEANMQINFSSLMDDETYADVTFKIGDNHFKCHRCIMACRCEYFSLMFNGHWIEKEQNIIELKDISSVTFMFIKSFIYTRQSDIPKDVDLAELFSISDMYNISGVKEIVKLHLMAYQCHFFHKPCAHCILGVIKTLQFCSSFALPDLLAKCYHWFITYYVMIFSNRNFSRCSEQLRKGILEKIKDSITDSNVIRHVKDCCQLKASLPSVNWARSTVTFISELEDFSMEFICKNFQSVMHHASFTYLLFQDLDSTRTVMILNIFVNAISKYISLDNCVDLYKQAAEIENVMMRDDKLVGEAAKRFVVDMQSVCKTFIQKNFIHIQRTKKWKKMRVSLKNELMEKSGFFYMENNDDAQTKK